MSDVVADFVQVHPMLTRGQVLARPSAVPAEPGVYGWWFDRSLPGIDDAHAAKRDEWRLLYVGISPKAPPRNGRPPSSQNLQKRVRYHFKGNAEGSTLRLTLGALLVDELGIELRRVGSGKRMTFTAVGEEVLSGWMADHARVTIQRHPSPWDLESHLIAELDLPLNLDQNNAHPAHKTVSGARRRARERARSLPIEPR